MSKRNFPSFIEAFLEYSKNVGAPHKFLLWSAVSGVAAALERKTWIHYNGVQVVYPNMYIMLIAESGIARKSTATRPIMEIIYDVEGLKHMSTQLSAASLIEQLVDAGKDKIFEFDKIKYQNSSLFAYASEAKVTIGDQKGLNGIQELLTDFYDCGTPNTWHDKKGWSKKTISGGHLTVFNPCLNLLACSTPIWLNEAIGKSGIEGGFASRVIFVTQKEREGDSIGWLNEDEYDTMKPNKMKKLLVEDLTQISKLQGVYKTAKGWKETFNEIKGEVEKKSDQSEDMKSYYSRKLWHCMKLAQILAADQSNSMTLTSEHLLAAKALLEKIEPDMYSAFSLRGENKSLVSFYNVWEIMRKKKAWPRQLLVNLTHRHANSSQLDEHLKTLTQMGKINPLFTEGKIIYLIVDNAPLGETNIVSQRESSASN